MKLKLRALAAVLALALALTAAGCHTSTPDAVGTVGGVEISSGLYLLAQFDAYQSAAQYAGDGQDPADVKAFLAETITPDGGEAVTVSDYVADETLNDLRRRQNIGGRSRKHGVQGLFDALRLSGTLAAALRSLLRLALSRLRLFPWAEGEHAFFNARCAFSSVLARTPPLADRLVRQRQIGRHRPALPFERRAALKRAR